jgi:hypothetical protein
MTETFVASVRDSGNDEAPSLESLKGNCFANHSGNRTCLPYVGEGNSEKVTGARRVWKDNSNVHQTIT